MKTRALLALWMGVGLMVLMGLFPPWFTYTWHNGNNFPIAGMPPSYRGYHPLFIPPMTLGTDNYAFIDVGRLIVQWVLVGSVTLALVLTLNRGRDSEQGEKRG